jgi:hypothetical protein
MEDQSSDSIAVMEHQSMKDHKEVREGHCIRAEQRWRIMRMEGEDE